MKAKYYIGMLSALALALMNANGQYADSRDFMNDEAGIVINNYYYDNYDYYYTSRINRFHRSYAAFDYYSPVFTEIYWYNYRPFSWGISIYGRSGIGFGYSINFPVCYGWRYYDWYDPYYGYYDPYYYSWYDSYWGNPYYYGYNPFYSAWYSPVVININLGYRWRNHYWYGHNYGYRHNYWYSNFRPAYYTYNYRDYNRYSSTRYSYRDY
ncbi:MAG TPA: hypothetical protein DDW27_08705, partial [Bacteroidales bacterium]|nr:hypothetical protein [Bacteroidales bacterium]